MTSFLARLRLKPQLQCEDLGQHLKQQSNVEKRKMHQRTDCFLFQSCQLCLSICPPVMFRLFHSYSNKLILCLCWDTDGWYIFLGRQYNIRSGSLHIRLRSSFLTEIQSARQRGGRSRWSPWYRDARLWCLIMSLGMRCVWTNHRPVFRSRDLSGPMRARDAW